MRWYAPDGHSSTSCAHCAQWMQRASAASLEWNLADARKFVAALIQIDFETVSQWAQSRSLAFTHFRSLVETPEVRELIDNEVRAGNARLAEVAHIRRFHLLTKELDHDDGEVTATMKVRRASIYKTYAGEIEALYR